MSLDYENAVYAAVFTRLNANSGVTSAFKTGNIHDERTDAGAARKRIGGRTPDKYPSLDVDLTGGDEPTTRTPHFGLAGPTVATCDAIVPATVTLRLRMRFGGNLTDETAALASVRQALHQGYPKLGLSYVRDFTIRNSRKPKGELRDAPEASEVMWTMTVNLRLRTSQLR